MALLYNAVFDKNTRKLSFEDRAGNEIYSFTVPEREKDDLTKPLTFRTTQDGSKVTLTRGGYPTGAFQTSRDGGNTWSDYTIDTAITLNIGDEVSFRAKADRTEHEKSYYFYFKMTGKIEAWHNVMSLLRTNDFATYESVVEYSLKLMFYGCKSLTKAPALPATTLAQYCYDRMFYGCTSLTKAPELPATTLAYYCYESMFEGCTSLKKALALPATTLANYCCDRMFYGCKSLTKAPELPATTLAYYCYNSMFYGCKSLTKAPELPATTLVDGCYESMFQGCTSLTKTPVLPATTFATTRNRDCYNRMFNGCSSLNEVRCQMPSSYSSSTISSLAYKWLEGVSSTGTFYTNSYAKWPSGVSGIPENWTRFNEKDPAVDDITKPLKFMTTQDGSTVTLTKYGSPSGDFQTSMDGGSTWVDYTIGTSITLNIGDEVAFRAKTDRTSAQTLYDYFYFKMTGKIEAWHNVMSLYSTNDFATHASMIYAFYMMFKDCTSLTKAPVLPATAVNTYGFYYMFKGCTSLTKAPELPKTKLAQYCYNSMFYGCKSLTKAPELPATTLVDRCYESMFEGCTSLTEAPELPATTLEFGCYNRMFCGCTSLTKAPALPVTTLANRCYGSMFSGCTSLTKAPDLPATKLTNECYQFMFYGCKSLTKAPALPAIKLTSRCYTSMFSGCTSLTKAPELPATTLTNECYQFMFYGCTSLTKTPELTAYSFYLRCYNGMFKNCSSLNEVHCRVSSEYSSSQISSNTKDWLSGVASTGTFYTNSDARWPSGASGIPAGWTRVNS